MTTAQIVTLALQIAKAPGFTSQAGQQLNSILSDLAQTYDFDVARNVFNFNFNTALGSGPIPLPSDYLRAEPNDVFYTISGQAYVLVNIDLSEFDVMVQTAGLTGFPAYYATDMSQSPPNMYVWPPPSGTYPVTIRYRSQMADIVTPETSAVVPWFPNQNYLITRLAGEMCKLTGDDRWTALLGDGPQGAVGILRGFLLMKDDQETRSKRVTLDRRRFGRDWNSLPNTKLIGF